MWNYRVVRKKNTYIDPKNEKERVDYTYSIHEAYYDENGYVGAITREPVEPFGDTVEELRHSWIMMAEAFGQPVLDYNNIPEPGYDRKKDPIGSTLHKRRKEIEARNRKGVPWENVKTELEKKWAPFDEDEYRKQADEERLEKERIHSEFFIGTPTLKELIKKMYADYQEYIQRERPENLRKYSVTDE
jgi:hypothetical protein